MKEPSRHELRLFAGLAALAILAVAARAQILRIAHLHSHYALLFYQDILAVAILAWLFHGLFAALHGERRQRMLALLGWAVCGVATLYTAIATIVFWYIRSPLTYRLIVISDNARGVKASLDEDLGTAAIAIGGYLSLALVLTILLWRGTPALLRRTHSAFYSLSGAAILIVYVAGSHWWVTRNVRFMSGVDNPEWAFVESVIESPRPTVAGAIPRDYFVDFRAVSQPPGARHAPAYDGLFDPAAEKRPLNVVLFVMESVGAKNLQLTGAPYPDSPRLIELARHAIVFPNTYVSQPFSSAAMTCMFSSLYPDHDWLTVPRKEPTIRVPGLPAVLAERGYRTAFIHAGMIDYDGNLSFLESAGFQQIISRPDDDIQPRDGELVPAALNWINQHRERPFFMAIWTRDTHNPYLSYTDHKYTNDFALNRYLNSITWTDEVIGRLAAELKRAGLADNTVLVIAGDHGEAFGEHGQSVHNFSVYNEEVRIPLMFVNERLIPRRIDVTRQARQLDIAPTVLDLLGLQAPATWQGTSLFAADRPSRAYLFSIAGDFRLGLAEGDFVFIRNYSRNQSELYNVARDFDEQLDLSADAAFAPMMARDRLRLEAWLDFQNKYLASFACPSCPVPHRQPESLEGMAAGAPAYASNRN